MNQTETVVLKLLGEIILPKEKFNWLFHSETVQNLQFDATSGTGVEMLKKKELVERLKVTVRTIDNRQAKGMLPYIKISGVVRFNWNEVIAHLNTNFRVSR